jgi:signal peptidase II
MLKREKIREKWLIVAALVIGFDQITKYLSTVHLASIHALPVFPGLDLSLRYNTGAAFSFLANAGGWQHWFFIGLALVVSAIIYLWLGRLSVQDKQEGLALSLILGGAIGNLMDRLTEGAVIDFIVLYYNQQWQWPAFNLADSAIFVGVLLLIPILWKKSS